MKLAIFSIAHPSYGGGFEQQIKKLGNELQKRKHTVTFVTLSKKATYKLAVVLSFLYFRPRFHFPELQRSDSTSTVSLKTFSNLADLKKLLKKYDVIYAKNEILDSFILSLIKNKSMPPVICGVHTVLQYAKQQKIHSVLHNFFYNSIIYTYLLHVFSAYHCINKFQTAFLKKRIDGKPLYYIPNFIDVPRNVLTSDKTGFKLLYVGRLTQQKGTDLLIKVIEKLSGEKFFSSLTVTICGAGAYEKEILSLTQRFNNIFYKGFLNQKELTVEYKKADLFVFPSRGESFPVVLLEAMSFGAVPVAFSIPGVTDIVNNKNGFLVRPESINGIANTIRMFYNLKRKKYREFFHFKQTAQQTIKQNYTTQKLMREYEKMFTQVVKK